MSSWKPAALALAVAAAWPVAASAQSNAELLQELKALKDRVNDLEKKLAAQPAAPAAQPERQWGMTPEQLQDFNRIAVKTEALEDNQEAMGFKGLKISGLIDPTFIYNDAANVSTFQLLNRDPYSYDSGYFGMAMLDFQKEMEGGTKWRLTLAPERGVGATFNGGSIIHEATVSIPTIDQQTRLLIGQIPDWSGYEYLPPNQNKLVTHNLLFDFTLPTAYTGISTDISRGKWIVKAGIANVNSSRDNPSLTGGGNKTPSLIYRVDYSKGEFAGFGFAGVHGKLYNYAADATDDAGALLYPDRAGKNTWADLFEVDAYFIRGDLTLQGQLSYGRQRRAAIATNVDTGDLQTAQWWGASVLGAYKLQPRLEAVARLDYLNNHKNGGGLLGYSSDDGHNGIGRGYVQDADGAWVIGDPNEGANRYALSIGLNYLLNEHTTLKAEYRLDRSNLAVFNYVSDGSYKKYNNLFGASVVVSF